VNTYEDSAAEVGGRRVDETARPRQRARSVRASPSEKADRLHAYVAPVLRADPDLTETA
jgi:hypothetical protein